MSRELTERASNGLFKLELVSGHLVPTESRITLLISQENEQQKAPGIVQMLFSQADKSLYI